MAKIAITGAGGRMGLRLVALSRGAGHTLIGAIERPDSTLIGRDAGELAGVGPMGVPITFDLRPTPEVLIDFSAPAATRHWLKVCRDRGIAMVIGTTGLHQVDHAAIDVAAEAIPVLQAGNMSLGVNLLLKLVGEVARRLGDDYDIEVCEAHHRHKKDAPSGTADALVEALLKATGRTRQDVVHGRHGDDAQRAPRSIGVHSLRLGDEVGRHTVYFGGPGERVELTHIATDRDVFARGALRAASWLAGRPPGRYTLADVLGL